MDEFKTSSDCLGFAVVCDWIDELNRDLIRSLKHCSEFQPIEDLHISLSKTFVLRHHCIEPLLADLQQAMALCRT